MEQKKGKWTRRRFLQAGVAAAGAGFVGDALLGEPNRLELVRTTVPIRGLPASLEGFKIAQVSDLHLGNWISPERVRDAVRLLNLEKPDLFALTGDFMHLGKKNIEDIETALSECAAPNGVYAVLGNHDHWADTEGIVRTLTTKTPAQMLTNRSVMIERPDGALALAGLGDLRFGVVKLDDALGGLPPDVPRILLQHHPDLAEEMPPGWRVDLQISGHTHGGQCCIPFVGWAPIVPSDYGDKFLHGVVEGKAHRVFVSKGIGGGAPMRPRVWARPDVALITLVAMKPETD